MSVAAATRVLIAIEPRLLSDVLIRVLDGPNVEIVVDTPAGQQPRHFDLAVVSAGAGTDLNANVVVRLPAIEGGEGSITTPSGTQPAVLGDLARLLEALNRFVGTV